jgi:hypothetical protein
MEQDIASPTIRDNRVGGSAKTLVARRGASEPAKEGQATPPVSKQKPAPTRIDAPAEGTGVAAKSSPSEASKEGQAGKDSIERPAEQKPKCFDKASLESSSAGPMGIRLKLSRPHVAQTPEMRKLVSDIFEVEHVIRLLFSDGKYMSEKKQFFDGLLASAKIGLCGTEYEIEAGQMNLKLTQDEIADAFPLLRDALWKSHLNILFWSTSVFLVLGGFVYYHLVVQQVFADHNQALLRAVPAFPQVGIALVLIPLGVPIGIFLEFVFRVGEKTTYDGLLAINPGRWKPWKRTITTLITAYVFAFIIGVGAFQIGIGGILLNDFISTQPWLSVAVGFVTGFTFPYVRDIVTQFKPERRNGGAGNPPGKSDENG